MSSILKNRKLGNVKAAVVAGFMVVSSMGQSAEVAGGQAESGSSAPRSIDTYLPNGIVLTEKSPAVLKLVDDIESRLENMISNGDYVDLVRVAAELKSRRLSQANTFISLIKSLQTADGHLDGCVRQCESVERVAKSL